jgi:hypothetical protein
MASMKIINQPASLYGNISINSPGLKKPLKGINRDLTVDQKNEKYFFPDEIRSSMESITSQNIYMIKPTATKVFPEKKSGRGDGS